MTGIVGKKEGKRGEQEWSDWIDGGIDRRKKEGKKGWISPQLLWPCNVQLLYCTASVGRLPDLRILP